MALIQTGNAHHVSDCFPAVNKSIHVRQAFTSPEAFAAWLASPESGSRWFDAKKNHMSDGEFYGHATYAEAIKLAVDGWQAGADRAAALRDKIVAARPHGPRLVRWSVAGAYPSVARAVSGNPLNMRFIDSARLRRRPVLTLVSHYGALGEISGDAMLRRAACVAAVVDVIEDSGYSAQVIAWTASQRDNRCGETAVILKDAGQPVNVARLAFGLGHPAMLRRLTFDARSAAPQLAPFGVGMGSTMYGVAMSAEQNAAGVYLVPAIQFLGEGNFQDDAQTVRTGLDCVIRSLASQGFPAFQQNLAA